MFKKILQEVEKSTPLVHNITNYVTVNDCANIILACGGSPIMADDIEEVEDITSICNSLVINMGTLNEQTVQSMIIAGRKANELGHPVVLDPVGVGASTLRTNICHKLIKNIKFSVIRGNISEIKTIFKGDGSTKGVDAAEVDKITENNLSEVIELSQKLSDLTDAVIVITGEIDIVANKNKAYIIKNGHPMMTKITGSGCMLSSVIGTYCGANKELLLDSTAAAVCSMGYCGELAYQKMRISESGTASFKTHLIDFMSKMNHSILNEGIKIETR